MESIFLAGPDVPLTGSSVRSCLPMKNRWIEALRNSRTSTPTSDGSHHETFVGLVEEKVSGGMVFADAWNSVMRESPELFISMHREARQIANRQQKITPEKAGKAKANDQVDILLAEVNRIQNREKVDFEVAFNRLRESRPELFA